MLPAGLQAWPWSQRPTVPASTSSPVQETEPLGLVPPPQQLWSLEHQVPVSRQPSAGRQTSTPEPGSKQIREQQLLPPVGQGSPPWTQPPAPPPATATHLPGPPSVEEQT